MKEPCIIYYLVAMSAGILLKMNQDPKLGAKFDLFSRVEPRCSGYRRRWHFHRFPDGPQSDHHTFLP
jgi:hypothetical protein